MTIDPSRNYCATGQVAPLKRAQGGPCKPTVSVWDVHNMCELHPPPPLPPSTFHRHLPPSTYHLPPTTCHLPPATFHLSPTPYHLPPSTFHLPPTTCRLPLKPSTYRLPPTTCHLPLHCPCHVPGASSYSSSTSPSRTTTAWSRAWRACRGWPSPRQARSSPPVQPLP